MAAALYCAVQREEREEKISTEHKERKSTKQPIKSEAMSGARHTCCDGLLNRARSATSEHCLFVAKAKSPVTGIRPALSEARLA